MGYPKKCAFDLDPCASYRSGVALLNMNNQWWECPPSLARCKLPSSPWWEDALMAITSLILYGPSMHTMFIVSSSHKYAPVTITWMWFSTESEGSQNCTNTTLCIICIALMWFSFCDDCHRPMFCNFKGISKTSHSTTNDRKIKIFNWVGTWFWYLNFLSRFSLFIVYGGHAKLRAPKSHIFIYPQCISFKPFLIGKVLQRCLGQ